MGKIEKIYEIIDNENIKLEILDSLPDHVEGMYLKDDDSYPIIAINKKIVDDRKKLSMVLAEELGHHFTSIGDSSVMFNSYSQRIKLSSGENKALRWATEFLLPLDEIKEAFIRYEKYGIEEVLDRLEVDRDFFIKRLEFISKYRTYTEIDSNTILDLSSLPNINIIRKLY